MVTFSVDYNADNGHVDFLVYDSTGSTVLTECHTTFGSDLLSAIGPEFKLEFGMDGYNSNDSSWDFVSMSTVPEPATLSLLLLGGLALIRRRKK